MQINSYDLFKTRLGKLPTKARKAIVESIKSSSSVKLILKEYIRKENKILLKEKSNWQRTANDMDNFDNDSGKFHKVLMLALSDAGYDGKIVNKFVDFIMKGNFEKFVGNLKNEENLLQGYEKGDPNGTSTGSFRTGQHAVGSNKRQGGVGRFSDGTAEPSSKKEPTKNDNYGDRKDPFGDRKEKEPTKNDNYGDRKDPFGDRKDPFGDRKEKEPTKNDNYGDRKDPFGDRKEKEQEFFDKGDRMGKKQQVQQQRKLVKKDPVASRAKGAVKGAVNKVKDGVKGAVNKAKNIFSRKNKDKLDEAIKNNDYNTLRLLKEELKKEIKKQLLLLNT